MRAFLCVLVAAGPLANADDSSCTNRDFRGVYAFHAQAVNPANNVPLTFAGILAADGNGRITAWKDIAATAIAQPTAQNQKLVTPFLDRFQESQSQGKEIQYTVEADCRLTITATFLGPTGSPSPTAWAGGLASGGKEALLINAGAQSPYVSIVTLKRAAR